MKFEFTGPTPMNTPLVGKTKPGDTREYEDDDPRCERLLRSSFFKPIVEHNTKAEKDLKKEKQLKEKSDDLS